MNHLPTIQRNIFGVLLLCLFLFSTTPSNVFHNLLSHHHDETIQHKHTHGNEIAIAGINCHWDSLVCESVYLNNLIYPSIIAPSFGASVYIDYCHTHYSHHSIFASLRGPPCLI